MIEFGLSGRTTGTVLLALAVGLTAAGPAAAKDVPGRKRCFVAGVETYKDEPVYRDKSSGYQRIQLPAPKGERCFWEPLDYQAAAASVPVEASRAAPAMNTRAEAAPPRAGSRPADQGSTELAVTTPPSPPPSQPPARTAPSPAPSRQASPPPQPLTMPQAEPQYRAAPPPEPEPEPPAPQPVRPMLQPRGLTSGGGASGVPDLRIQTRPVASGGTVSTVTSGPGLDSLIKEDNVVPMGEPVPLDGNQTMASLAPDSGGWEPMPPSAAPEPAPEYTPPPPVRRQAPPPEPAPSRPAATASEGGSFVQLGSVPTYQKAKQFWTDVTGRYPEILSGLTPNIVEADIPGKGIYYRVRVGPFESGEAKALCKRLGEGKCLVVGR